MHEAYSKKNLPPTLATYILNVQLQKQNSSKTRFAGHTRAEMRVKLHVERKRVCIFFYGRDEVLLSRTHKGNFVWANKGKYLRFHLEMGTNAYVLEYKKKLYIYIYIYIYMKKKTGIKIHTESHRSDRVVYFLLLLTALLLLHHLLSACAYRCINKCVI